MDSSSVGAAAADPAAAAAYPAGMLQIRTSASNNSTCASRREKISSFQIDLREQARGERLEEEATRAEGEDASEGEDGRDSARVARESVPAMEREARERGERAGDGDGERA